MTNGIGEFTSRMGGATYKGQWKNDQQHGKGIEKWFDNSTYEGEFKNGKKHGQGTYKWANGSIYIGEWRNNVISG